MLEWSGILLQGVLTGGLYALFAAGLAMSFGILRLVNLAHGDLVVLGCFAALVVTERLDIHPFVSLLIVTPLGFGLGYALQRGLLSRVTGQGELPPLLTTFGLSVALQNGLLELFTADTRKLQAGPIEVQSIELLPGLSVGVLPLIMFASAIVVMALLHALFYRTAIGRSFRAAADDPRTLSHMGYAPERVHAMAMGIAMAVCALAAVFLATRTQFSPLTGPSRLLFAFEAVIVGGMGSLWGAFLGAVLLGVAQAVGGAFDPGLETLAGHLMFLTLLMLRPQGLIPKGN